MKFKLIFLLGLFLISCSNEKNTQNESQIEESEIYIEPSDEHVEIDENNIPLPVGE